MIKQSLVLSFSLALLCLGLPLPAQAPLDVRIALVIGNAEYLSVPPLENAVNDAKAVAQSLRSLGFTVEELRDASKPQMVAALERVRKSLQGQHALGMLYYAGHGFQVDWRNYMLPVDVRPNRGDDLSQQSLDIGAVVNTFKDAGTRMNILVLDACRDNPFGKSSTSAKGLAPMDAPPGTLLAYATQPGNVAEDGEEGAGNGPYAQYLTTELRRPFARVEDVFKRVRLQVRQKTEGRQIPWESTSLEEDFVFNDGRRQTGKAVEQERLASEAKRREQQLQQQALAAKERERLASLALEKEREQQAAAAKLAAEHAERQKAAQLALAKEAERLAAQERERALQRLSAEGKRRDDERLAQETQARERERALAQEQALAAERQRALDQALAKAQAQEQARQQQAALMAQLEAQEHQLRERSITLSKTQQREQQFAAEKADWDRVRDSKASEPIYAYLVKYPNGSVSELAQAKLEQLAKAKIQPAPDQSGQVQPFEARRFVLGDQYQFVVRDLLTKVEDSRPSFTVIAADRETAEFNQGYKVTQAGAIIRTIAGATLDPYQQWIPAGPYQLGQKWTTRSTMTLKSGQVLWVELTGKVIARETISVPAGSFDTYKMEMEQTAQDGTRLKITYWGQPDWGVAVKQIRELRDTRGGYSGQIYEMLSRKRGP